MLPLPLWVKSRRLVAEPKVTVRASLEDQPEYVGGRMRKVSRRGKYLRPIKEVGMRSEDSLGFFYDLIKIISMISLFS